MKQREQYVVRETTTTGRKDDENSRKSMQSTCTWEMDVLRSLSNPEEMDDTELLKDLSRLGKPPSFDGKIRCLSIQQWIREKRLFLNQVP